MNPLLESILPETVLIVVACALLLMGASPRAQVRRVVPFLAAGVGILLVLLAWPSNRDATGNGAIDYATEAGEFFGLMLLSIAGVFLVAGANDIILLFLGVELASIPTYVMVSVSRAIADTK